MTNQKHFDKGDLPEKDCDHCLTDIIKFRRNVVLGDGPLNARLMLIGEAPGYDEDKSGKPFVGKAGAMLDYLLKEAGLDRKEIYITNVVKCRPTYLGRNRAPTDGEMIMCKSFLINEIFKVGPEIICPMGRIAANFFEPHISISKHHGNILEWKGKMIMPLYHPAVALYNKEMISEMIEDMKSVARALEEIVD